MLILALFPCTVLIWEFWDRFCYFIIYLCVTCGQALRQGLLYFVKLIWNGNAGSIVNENENCSLFPLRALSVFLFWSANRYSPSKRGRNSIVPMKSSSQELLSPQREDRAEDRAERLMAARSLASLDGQGEQTCHREYIPLMGLFITAPSESDQLKLLKPFAARNSYSNIRYIFSNM